MISTIEGINSDNYDQPSFYYKLFNNNNRVTVIIQTQDNTAPSGTNHFQVSMDGQRWFSAGDITTVNSNFYDASGISAIRINPDPTSPPFLMQIFEGGYPVIYMERG